MAEFMGAPSNLFPILLFYRHFLLIALIVSTFYQHCLSALSDTSGMPEIVRDLNLTTASEKVLTQSFDKECSSHGVSICVHVHYTVGQVL